MDRCKINPRNDRIKRDYLIWLKEAKQRSTATVDQARHAIDRFEEYTGFKDFATFNKDQALGFKAALAAKPAQRTGAVMSIATVHHTLRAIQGFLAWIQGQQEFRRRIKIGDIAYLNLTTGDERRARTTSPKLYPSFEEFRTALFAMPARSEIERRNRALMAYLLLTCARDSAAIGLKMRDVDIDRKFVFQDPRHTKTKFSKAIDTYFYPVGDDVTAIFEDWMSYLTQEKGFGPDDPVFPRTVVLPDADQKFTAAGIGRDHWATAAPVRQCFKETFARIGLGHTEPHSVRDTLTAYGYSLGLDAEKFKAWSQNMAHDKPLTTLNSYGKLSRERQGEIILGLALKPQAADVAEMSVLGMAEMLAAKLKALEAA